MEEEVGSEAMVAEEDGEVEMEVEEAAEEGVMAEEVVEVDVRTSRCRYQDERREVGANAL